MEVYGLYGKSGTGKSHKSSEIISDYQIDAVIDDGILIIKKMRVAGKSAKNERTMHAATKRAIFSSDEHRQEVVQFLKKSPINKLLVIGTSQKMVQRIVERLQVPTDIEWIPIESFQTEEEIRLARERRSKGYHVIPIHPVEVEKTYEGSWFRKLVIRYGKRKAEVTLIKPSYIRGNIKIAPQSIRSLVLIEAKAILHIHSVQVDKERVLIILSTTRNRYSIDHLREWRNHMTSVISYLLGIPYVVDIEWHSIILSKTKERRG